MFELTHIRQKKVLPVIEEWMSAPRGIHAGCNSFYINYSAMQSNECF